MFCKQHADCSSGVFFTKKFRIIFSWVSALFFELFTSMQFSTKLEQGATASVQPQIGKQTLFCRRIFKEVNRSFLVACLAARLPMKVRIEMTSCPGAPFLPQSHK